MAKTNKKTNKEKVLSLLSSGKRVKLTTLSKKLYNNTDSNSLDNARRIINHLKDDGLKVKLVDTGIYQAK